MYICTLKEIGMTEQNTPLALGTERIGKLLMQYAIPAIIAMTASSLYNMVDSIFIGHGVGALAISGLALTFPLMNLAAAFGSLVGVGASTLISVKLGQKDYDTAQRVLGNVLVLNVIIGLLFTIVTLIFLDPILYFFGGSDATVGYARDYMVVILLGNIITHRTSAEGHVCHDCHCACQYPARSAVYLCVRLGHTGGCYCHDYGTGAGAYLAVQAFFQQERTPAFS